MEYKPQDGITEDDKLPAIRVVIPVTTRHTTTISKNFTYAGYEAITVGECISDATDNWYSKSTTRLLATYGDTAT